MNSSDRPGWDEYFMELAQVVKKRSDCIRGHRGSIIVKDKRIIATGYNGTPMGAKNCFEGGCERCKLRQEGKLASREAEGTCICLHAEENAVIQSAYHGTSTIGATLYTTDSPCTHCSIMIINAGIKRVVYGLEHHDQDGLPLLTQSGIVVELLK